MEFRYQIGDEITSLQVERLDGKYRVTIGERVYTLSAHRAGSGELALTVNGRRHSAYVAAAGTARFVAIDGQTFELTLPKSSRARRRGQRAGEDNLTASMPGQVRKVLIAEGEAVERGQTLVVLEAMKMEIRVTAPHAGRVAKLRVSEGQVVDRGQALVELTAADK